MGLWDCGTVGLWDSCGRLNDPSLARQACFLESEMIIWVCGTVGLWDCGFLYRNRTVRQNHRSPREQGSATRFKPSLARRALVREKEMIIWVG